MRLLAKVAGLSAVAVAGVLLAVALPAQGQTETTTSTEVSTVESTVVTTVESTAIVTNTVEQTTTRQILAPTSPTTTAETSSDNGTAAWIWVLLAILGVGLIVFAILLARRSGGHTVSPDERRRRLDNAVGSWVAQGWAIESQDADSAVLRRVDDLVLVHVDTAGHVSARPFGA